MNPIIKSNWLSHVIKSYVYSASIHKQRVTRRYYNESQGAVAVHAEINNAMTEVRAAGVRGLLMDLYGGSVDDEIRDFLELTRDRSVEVRFIEFMPISPNKWEHTRLVPHTAARELRRATSHSGLLDFISITKPFCTSCIRLGLTADGNVKVCLFDSAEGSLRNKAQHNPFTRSPLARHAGGARFPAHSAHQMVAMRAFSSGVGAGAEEEQGPMSHLDGAGRARMVDVSDKPVTARAASAECRLEVSGRVLRLLADARLPKGDALCVARVAGTLAAKRTADLLPLCHPLPLECARVHVRLPPGAVAAGARGSVLLTCEVRVTARTGAEMEALTGCAVAALALYDMCKSVDRDMRISDLRLVTKSGGRSDLPPTPALPPLRPLTAAPDAGAETFAPTNFMHY